MQKIPWKSKQNLGWTCSRRPIEQQAFAIKDPSFRSMSSGLGPLKIDSRICKGHFSNFLVPKKGSNPNKNKNHALFWWHDFNNQQNHATTSEGKNSMAFASDLLFPLMTEVWGVGAWRPCTSRRAGGVFFGGSNKPTKKRLVSVLVEVQDT